MHNKSIAELSRSLQAGEFTSVELTRHMLQRIGEVGSPLNALITVTGELALEQAAQADARRARGEAGPLTGIPIAHKDIFCTRGVRTSCGSRMLSEFVSPYDATVVERLHGAGAVLLNQTPMIRGINDTPRTMASLFRELAAAGVSPYYVFQCRPALGNKPYSVPVEEGYRVFESAKTMVSGLAKQARFVMSHALGKIEVVGVTDRHTFFKFHRAADDRNSGKFLVRRSNPHAHWFDDYDRTAMPNAPLGRVVGHGKPHPQANLA